MNIVTERWKKTRLLNKVPPELMDEVAKAFQSQVDFNSLNDELEPRFKRISIPIVRRVLPYVEFKTTSKNAGYLLSDIDMPPEEGHENFSLDKEAEFTATVAEKLQAQIADWNETHGTLGFHSLGVVNGKIAIYIG